MTPSLETGDDMVDGKGLDLFSAVLADKIIAVENFPPRQFVPGTRASHVVLQPDDRRHGNRELYCVEQSQTVLQHFRFALVAQEDGAPYLADVDGFVILVQHQHRVIEHFSHISLVVPF